MSLQPFKAKPRCPKCGGADVYSDFHDVSPKWAISHGSYPGCNGPLRRAHLVRHCRSCSFEWYERPKDAKAKPRRRVRA
jgi:hypothetical protein